MPQKSIKVMQTYGKITWEILKKEAYKKDITVQNFVRTIIIPDWLKLNNIELPSPLNPESPEWFKSIESEESEDNIKEQPSRAITGWNKKMVTGLKRSEERRVGKEWRCRWTT